MTWFDLCLQLIDNHIINQLLLMFIMIRYIVAVE